MDDCLVRQNPTRIRRPLTSLIPRCGYTAMDGIEYAQFYSRSHHAVIRVYDEAANVIETHEHKGDFKEW
jgi:hypothetical protein